MKPSRFALSCFVVLLAGAVLSCGDDDPIVPGDTTPPFVVSFDPALNATAVSTDKIVIVVFNEDMDINSAAGNVFLSAGTVTSLTWADDRTLRVGHTSWAQGAEITVTVGTGLEDAAGNALAAEASTRFWTQTPVVSLLTTEPEDGAVGVARNSTVQMLFSHPMNLGSLASAITATDLVSSQQLSFTLDSGGGNWAILTFNATLPPSAGIEIVISTAAQSTGGTNLDAETTFGFTTGTVSDTTPPVLVSAEPASGSVIPPDTGYLRFTFSEPIDVDAFTPSRLGAQFALLLEESATEPAWTNNNTVVTVALPVPLPAGFPIVVHFDSYRDAAGNVQTTPIQYQVTVEGTADYYPVVDGERFVYDVHYLDVDSLGTTIGEGYYREYQAIEVVSASLFNLVDYADPGYTLIDGWDRFQRIYAVSGPGAAVQPADEIQLIGFHEIDGPEEFDVDLDPPVSYIRTPWSVRSWSGTASATTPDGEFVVNYMIEVEATEDVVVRDTEGPLDGGGTYWIGCWRWKLTFDLETAGTVMSYGTETMWFAPTVGVVQRTSEETNENGDVQTREEYLLIGGSS